MVLYIGDCKILLETDSIEGVSPRGSNRDSTLAPILLCSKNLGGHFSLTAAELHSSVFWGHFDIFFITFFEIFVV